MDHLQDELFEAPLSRWLVLSVDEVEILPLEDGPLLGLAFDLEDHLGVDVPHRRVEDLLLELEKLLGNALHLVVESLLALELLL